MPLPLVAISGIPWLAGILGALFASLVSFFVKYFTKRLAIVIAVIAALIGLTTAFFVAIQALLVGLAVATPQPIVDGMSLFLPSNTIGCITAVTTGYVIQYIYHWNVGLLQYKLF